MKFFEVLKEVFDFNLFKRNMQNAISTIQSEMQNVQATMTEKDKTVKEKEEENQRLSQQVKDMTSKVRAQPQQKATIGTEKKIATKI